MDKIYKWVALRLGKRICYWVVKRVWAYAAEAYNSEEITWEQAIEAWNQK